MSKEVVAIEHTHDAEPDVGIEKGTLVCPLCWSLCLVRQVDQRRGRVQWQWWCGCGWTSELHVCPHGSASLVQRFSTWRKLNGWPE